MFHPRNAHLLMDKEEFFFDRDPGAFEVILNFYRTGRLIVPDWLPMDLLYEELKYFSLDVPPDIGSRRVSMDLLKFEPQSKIADAAEYRRITRHKLLKDHQAVLNKILEKFIKKIEKNSALGHTSCEVQFLSPLHYTNSTPRPIFNIISKDEIRELIIELFKEKNFDIKPYFEYSKTKSTAIIGLDDQVINKNDPKYFSFIIKW
uniref:Potassium channel tetramerisation-type BTB domain-containing protein n=1 Tax=Arcella intermedia TaxID=1963864 RepID=A0A6B2LG97_9EUKA